MALPSSGALSFQDIATELGVNPPLSLAAMSTTAGFTAPYAVTDFYGYSGGGVITDGLVLNLDASNPSSYSGTGDTWTDLSTSGNNATLVNSPTFSSGNGGYLSFNGSNQYGSVPFNTNAPTTSFTEMAWVYINSTSVGGGITSDIFMGGGSIPLQYFNSYGNNAASTGQWVFVVGTQSTAPLQQLYINASTANIVSAAATQTFGWTGLPYFIGKRFDSIYANVRIGQVMVYDRALSASEVLQNYDATKERFGIVTSGLILNLDAGNPSSYSGSGTTWTDISGNNRISTLAGYGGGSTPSYSTLGGGSILFNRSSPIANSAAVFSLTTGGTPWADLTSTVSLSLWFYTGTSSVMIIAGKGFRNSPNPQEAQAYQFYTNGTSIIARVTAGGATSNIDVSTTFSYNTWTNVVLTYNGTTVSVYKNGILANSAAKTGAITNILSLPFIVGAQYNANNGYNLPTDGFNGYVGQILLYNTALTDADILQNYNATKARFGL